MGFIKGFVIFTLFLTTATSAQLSSYISEIDDLMSHLTNKTDKISLQTLRNSAIDLAKSVNECNRISINSVPDAECTDIIKTKLPKFESDFATVSNGIYLNPLKLVKSLTTKKEQINSCIESARFFYTEKFYPENMIKLNQKRFVVNPTKNDATVSIEYEIVAGFDESRATTFHNALKKWYKVCYPIVTDSVSFNEYFIQKLSEIVPSDEYEIVLVKGTISVIPKNHDYSYVLNGTSLFETDLYTMMHKHNNLSKYENTWIQLKANRMELQSEMDNKSVFIRASNESKFIDTRIVKVSKNGIEGNLIVD